MKEGKLKHRKLWIGIGTLIVLAPLGLILPDLFKAGGAWGEWGAEEIKGIVGYVPKGLKHISEYWSAPFSGYTFAGWNKGVKSYIAYILSGVAGVAIVVAASYVVGKILNRKKE